MNSKLISAVGLSLFCLIILLPPIIHGYVYPNIGDDTAMNLDTLDKIKIGAPVLAVPYCAYYIIGYPLDIITRIFDVSNDILFFWFNYLALIGIGVSLFFIFKNLISLSAGLLALILPIFTSYSVLLLFYSGVIFNIINMGIILPLACYCTIKWWMTRSKRYAIGAVCLYSLFAVFHSTGVYLPFIVLAGLILLIIYKRVKRQPILKGQIVFIVAVVFCGGVLFALFHPILDRLSVVMTASSEGISGLLLLQESLLHYMSPAVLAIIIVSIILLAGKYQHILVAEKLTVALFGLSAIIMLPPMLFRWSPLPIRQGMDFAILLSIVAVALVGIVIRLNKSRVVAMVLVGLVLGGAVINMSHWLGGYNSALEKIDIEAINYINSLQGEAYSCGDNIDHWIYDRYVNKEYLPLEGDIFIARNVPMKSKVALPEQGDLASWSHGGASIKTTFTDDDTMIEIYKRGGS